MKPLSWDAAWQDLVTMARTRGSEVLVIAGVFLLLPSLAMELWLPLPEIESLDWNGLRKINAFILDNAPFLIVTTLVGWFGTAAIYRLLLDHRRPSVAEAMKAAGALFLSLVLLNWLSGFALFLGLFAFVVPGLYLLGRLAVAIPAMIAEDNRNPLGAFNRSLELTRGNGWRTAGLLFIVLFVAQIAGSAAHFIFGIPLKVLTAGDLEHGLLGLLAAVITTAQGVLFVLLSAAIYGQLSARPRPAASS